MTVGKFKNAVPLNNSIEDPSIFRSIVKYNLYINYKYLSIVMLSFRRPGIPIPGNISRPNCYRQISKKIKAGDKEKESK